MELINKKILYVEDEEDIREELEFFLSLRFSEVIVAKNGLEGVEKFYESNPDLIITDVMMPVMNGIDMVKKLQSDLNDKLCPVIVMTAFNNSDTKMEDIQILRISHIISKPIEPFDLLKTINTALGYNNVK